MFNKFDYNFSKCNSRIYSFTEYRNVGVTGDQLSVIGYRLLVAILRIEAISFVNH